MAGSLLLLRFYHRLRQLEREREPPTASAAPPDLAPRHQDEDDGDDDGDRRGGAAAAEEAAGSAQRLPSAAGGATDSSVPVLSMADVVRAARGAVAGRPVAEALHAAATWLRAARRADVEAALDSPALDARARIGPASLAPAWQRLGGVCV